MNRILCIFACLVMSLSIFGCSASSTELDGRSVSTAPTSAQIEASWNTFAASYGFSSIQHQVTFGSMYGGSTFTTDMFRLGEDINADLNYDTGIQNQGAGVMFCEFTGDGCTIPPKK